MTVELDAETALFLKQVEGLIPVPPRLDSSEAVVEYLAQMAAAGSTNLLEGDPEPVHRIEDLTLDGPSGPLALRLYRPEGEHLPVIVFVHGGAFFLGDIDMHGPGLTRLANAIPAIVLAVDYRLAPEHPFPAAADDCFAALAWAGSHAGGLGGDPDRLVVMGDSAGGALAAVSAMRARDEGAPTVQLQVLLYPMIDPALNTESAVQLGDGYMTTRPFLEIGWHAYLAARRSERYASPAGETDLAGLAPAVVVTAGYDPLRDEGQEFARRLAAAGVDVTTRHYADQIHGFMFMPAVTGRASEALAETAALLKDILSTDNDGNHQKAGSAACPCAHGC